MGLPQSIRVKISSEAAGYVSLTPVVVQEMALLELMEHIAAQTGGDRSRVGEVLRRGSTVSGASRLRWEPLRASNEDLAEATSRLPSPEPGRPLHVERCLRVVLAGGGQRREMEQAALARRRWLKTRSCWDVLAPLLAGCHAEYVGYLYRERADIYRIRLDTAQRAAVKQACALLRFDVRVAEPEFVELIVARQ